MLHDIRVFNLFALIVSISPALGSQDHLQQSLTSPVAPSLQIRPATVSDAPVIAAVLIDAFYDSPLWRYAFQFRDQYPDDAFRCINQSVTHALQRGGERGARVRVGVVDGEGEQKGERVAVSVAAWRVGSDVVQSVGEDEGRQSDQAFLLGATSMSPSQPLLRGPLLLSGMYASLSRTAHGLQRGDDACANRRDLNVTRAVAFQRRFEAEQKRWLDDRIPTRRQLYLDILATQPMYQGRDIAGELLREGIRDATARGSCEGEAVDAGRKANGDDEALWATLIATDAGEPLYSENRFQSRANITIKALDGDEKFRYDVMVRRLCKSHA